MTNPVDPHFFEGQPLPKMTPEQVQAGLWACEAITAVFTNQETDALQKEIREAGGLEYFIPALIGFAAAAIAHLGIATGRTDVLTLIQVVAQGYAEEQVK